MLRSFPSRRILIVCGFVLFGISSSHLLQACPITAAHQQAQSLYQQHQRQQMQAYYQYWLAQQQQMQQMLSHMQHASTLDPTRTYKSAHPCNKQSTLVQDPLNTQQIATTPLAKHHHYYHPSSVVQDPTFNTQYPLVQQPVATLPTQPTLQQCSCKNQQSLLTRNYHRNLSTPSTDPTATTSTQQPITQPCHKHQQSLLTRTTTTHDPITSPTPTTTPLQPLDAQSPLAKQFQATQLQYAHLQTPTVTQPTSLQPNPLTTQPATTTQPICQKQQSLLTRSQYSTTPVQPTLPTTVPQDPLTTQQPQYTPLVNTQQMYPNVLQQIYFYSTGITNSNCCQSSQPGIMMVDITSIYLVQMNNTCSQLLQQGTQNWMQYLNPILRPGTPGTTSSSTQGVSTQGS